MLTDQQILAASFNDILFQDRNKGYGAYQLRNVYNRHMGVALGAMIGVCLASFAFYFSGPLSGGFQPPQAYDPGVVTLIQPPPPVPALPPPPPQANVQPLRTEVYTAPLLVVADVKPDELPPEQEDLLKSVIGLQKLDGQDAGSIVAPPPEKQGTGLAVQPPATTEMDYDDIFTRAESPAEFPGGPTEWTRYLQKNLRYPDAAIENGTQAVVRVQFVVDRDGNISDVEALNDPGDGLAEEAVRIIKKGPKWRPAEQNGRKVIYRHIQAITFRLE